MTTTEKPPSNSATGQTNYAERSTVGVMAEAIHGDVNVYQSAKEAPAEEKFRTGASFLDGGMPSQARQHIEEAVNDGYVTSEVCFHWVLAILSGRTVQQLSEEDIARIGMAHHKAALTGDAWSNGLKTVFRLLQSLSSPGVDLEIVAGEVDELGRLQRDMILRHLERFLDGPIRNYLWEMDLQRVTRERMGNDRVGRAWKFFHATPAKPRLRPPAPPALSAMIKVRAIAGSVVFAAAYCYVVDMMLGDATVLAVVAMIGIAASGALTGSCLLEQRCQRRLMQVKEQRYRVPRQRTRPPPGGFADDVDRLFGRYFERYLPEKAKRQVWLRETAGIRRSLRDEIVENYRESRVTADEVAWLIRHEVAQVKQRWQDHTLLAYREQLRVPVGIRAGFVLGLVVFIPCAVWVAGTVAVRSSYIGAAALLVAVASGWVSAVDWLGIGVETRRSAIEQAEYEERSASAEAAYRRWVKKLENRPSDSEIARWLDCDRRFLMNSAMRHYRLRPSDILAYASLDGPTGTYKKARVVNGPWRYSRCVVLVFLLTADGVRQITSELDFQKGTFHDQERNNYRFDAVASVQVSRRGQYLQTFQLTLVSGHPIRLDVVHSTIDVSDQDKPEPDDGSASDDESAPDGQHASDGQSIPTSRSASDDRPGSGGRSVPSDMDLDDLAEQASEATGLRNTMHVLEGIAAEGKDWLIHQHQRRYDRMRTLIDTIECPSD